MKLLIATQNPGKVREYAEILQGLPVDLVSLSDLQIHTAVEETGETYTENALLKARTYAAKAGLPTLADDSGLEVDALGGAPGVRSARYAGKDASDRDRYELLLRNLEDVPEEERNARFRCVIAIVWPDGSEQVAQGTVEGRIVDQPRGEHGFGYDPVFHVPAFYRTMAELAPEIKNRISHRARAGEKARQILEAHIG